MRYSFCTLFILLCLTFPSFCHGQDSLEFRGFLQNKIHLLVPSAFHELSADVVAERFPNPKLRPKLILTDQGELTSLKIIIMPQELKANEVAGYKSFYVQRMKMEPNQEWISDGVKKINGRDVGYIKVIHTDKNTYAYYFFTSLDGKLLLLTYNCHEAMRPLKEEMAERIVASLKVE